MLRSHISSAYVIDSIGMSAFGKEFGQLRKQFFSANEWTNRDKQKLAVPESIFDGLSKRYLVCHFWMLLRASRATADGSGFLLIASIVCADQTGVASHGLQRTDRLAGWFHTRLRPCRAAAECLVGGAAQGLSRARHISHATISRSATRS